MQASQLAIHLTHLNVVEAASLTYPPKHAVHGSVDVHVLHPDPQAVQVLLAFL
jgi:hypothetical protein